MARDRTFGCGEPWLEAVQLPQDGLGFVRRECERCHRLFKVKASALEGELVWKRLAGAVLHQNAHEASHPLSTRWCPYCGHRAPDDAWFTAEQRAWLDARAETLELELRYEVLAHVERTLSVNPSPSFIAVRPPKPRGRLQPEPDDMRVVPLLCCSEEIKVVESWPGPAFCFSCGLEHELHPRRLLADLEALVEPF